ncbi:adenylate/guanylate cyclase domain-containing protein [Aurantiacibacter sp. MUD11]|uniref:CHASE2 domain-containing protein n=1 Tax=Aurantiacibacter sp. MUD11 TaxID=3003265 RepID=UPI0022AA939F|nr:adenylate/guanylate cyclase domain-containing protein [Aurantiacibacter sp. MUD11]WAT18921.1 adenylate/guanylate cyclase domain-containing protein [Aurantiacibacter sp. MUD11]
MRVRHTVADLPEGKVMAALLARLSRIGPQLAGALVVLLVLLLWTIGPTSLEQLRLQVFDSYQRMAPRGDANGDIVAVVDIDEASIEELGQWPWPRTDIATLTTLLGKAGASVVVFDIAFAEPDRTSPAQIAARYEAQKRADVLGEGFADLPSHDALLADSFGDVPVVTGYFLDPRDIGGSVEPKMPFTTSGRVESPPVAEYAGVIATLPELEAAAAGNGFVQRGNDSDEIVRRVPLLAMFEDTPVPSLSLEAVRVALGAGNPMLVASDGSGQLDGAGSAVAVRLTDIDRPIEIPVTDSGEMWVHFPDESTRELWSAADIITGRMSAEDLAEKVDGRIVLVGSSANALSDVVATPLSGLNAGVVVQAAAVEQMMTGDFLERPDWAPAVELLLLLVLGLGLALVLPRIGAVFGAVLALSAMALVSAASWFSFTRLSYLLDPVYPLLAILIVYLVQTAYVFFREERQRQYIRSAFDRYLSPELVKQIAASPEKLELGGVERDMSVLMCDVRGFSRISEQYAPNEVIDFLIEFLTPMSDILLARKATIDKYIGDAILAFWNAPLDDPDHHRNAARAALEMIAATDRLNREMPSRDGVVWPGEVKVGIGLNSGLCCVGNMGSRQRLNYSLIGDTVNLAARLEGQTKQYGVPIIVGAALAEQLDDFALLEIDRLRVVGRERPETIFALLGDESMSATDAFRRLAEAHGRVLAAYRQQDWDAARAALGSARADYSRFGIAGLHDLLAARIEDLTRTPPPADWDGVFQATQK